MTTTSLEPFDLAAALAGRETVTRDGGRVLAIWDSGLDFNYPVVAYIEGNPTARTFTRKGVLVVGSAGNSDLFHPPAWRLPDPPPGKNWHRDDWTEEMLPEGYRPLMDGELPESGDEICSVATIGRWMMMHRDALKKPARQNESHQRTRRLPPAKKRLTLGPEDAPPGTKFRHIDAENHAWAAPSEVTYDGVLFWAYNPDTNTGESLFRTWRELMNYYLFLRRGATSWQPCWKEVDA